ncbi:MAG: flagellar basal body P-ring formation protein FlgA [Candidatus Omnitrophica bacterium]|nr:flagellar basal body P-ring formation protein FlgA [Candidatus Omnitrophota bacterium]
MKKLLLCAYLLTAAISGRAEQVVPGQEILELCREYVGEKSGHPAESLVIIPRSRVPDLTLPEGYVKMEVSGRVEEREIGRVPLQVTVRVDGKEEKVLYVALDVDTKANAFVTTSWVRRGGTFSPGNLTPVETTASDLPPDHVKTLEQLKGKVAKVALPKGRVLSHRHIEEPAIVDRGAIVDLVVDAAGLQIETKGKVLSDGKRGERVKVRNLRSGKIVYGQVRNATTVTVEVY